MFAIKILPVIHTEPYIYKYSIYFNGLKHKHALWRRKSSGLVPKPVVYDIRGLKLFLGKVTALDFCWKQTPSLCSAATARSGDLRVFSNRTTANLRGSQTIVLMMSVITGWRGGRPALSSIYCPNSSAQQLPRTSAQKALNNILFIIMGDCTKW